MNERQEKRRTETWDAIQNMQSSSQALKSHPNVSHYILLTVKCHQLGGSAGELLHCLAVISISLHHPASLKGQSKHSKCLLSTCLLTSGLFCSNCLVSFSTFGFNYICSNSLFLKKKKKNLPQCTRL